MLQDCPETAARLRGEIAALIGSGLNPGDPIPTEAALSGLFQVSRTMLQAAIGQLEADGLVRDEPGRGRCVAPSPRPSVRQAITRFESFTDMARSQGYEPTNRVVSLSEIAASRDVAAALQCAEGTPMALVERLRYRGDTCLIYCRDYVRRDLLPETLAAFDWQRSLFDLLGDIGLWPCMSLASASARLLPEPARHWPELAEFGPAFLVAETCYTDRGVPVVFAEDYHCGDAFAFDFIRK